MSNAEKVRKAIDEIWNSGNINYADEIVHPKYIGHLSDGSELHGLDGFKAAASGMKAAFSKTKMEVVKQVSEGDEVITYLGFSGVHSAPLVTPAGTLQPTHAHIKVGSSSWVRFQEGKIIEERMLYDEAGMMRQLKAAS